MGSFRWRSILVVDGDRISHTQSGDRVRNGSLGEGGLGNLVRLHPARSGTRMSFSKCNSISSKIHHPPGPPFPRKKGLPMSVVRTEAACACANAGRGETISSP